MRNVLFLTVIVFFMLCVSALASGLQTVSDVEKSTEAALKLVKNGQIDEFVETFKPIWKMPEKEINEAKEKLVNQKKQAGERYGKTLDIQYVKTEVVADTLIKIDYVQKFENNAMRWTFYYYKPATEWYLNTFFWDPQINLLFK